MLRLSEFLLARIAEDEDAANGVNRGLFNSRVAMLPGDLYGLVIRQHPARVMAECEAKRRIVELHAIKVERGTMEGRYSNGETFLSGYESARCLTCGTLDQTIGCPTLRLLALPYADHEDFQEEWRP